MKYEIQVIEMVDSHSTENTDILLNDHKSLDK